MQQGNHGEIHGRAEGGDANHAHRRVGGTNVEEPPTDLATGEREARGQPPQRGTGGNCEREKSEWTPHHVTSCTPAGVPTARVAQPGSARGRASALAAPSMTVIRRALIVGSPFVGQCSTTSIAPD